MEKEKVIVNVCVEVVNEVMVMKVKMDVDVVVVADKVKAEVDA